MKHVVYYLFMFACMFLASVDCGTRSFEDRVPKAISTFCKPGLWSENCGIDTGVMLDWGEIFVSYCNPTGTGWGSCTILRLHTPYRYTRRTLSEQY